MTIHGTLLVWYMRAAAHSNIVLRRVFLCR